MNFNVLDFHRVYWQCSQDISGSGFARGLNLF